MIEELRITGLGVIESSTLEMGPGLTVITGETGAGKTMLVTALGLLLGGRADSGAVRTGLKTARVEGIFRLAETTSGRSTRDSDGEAAEASPAPAVSTLADAVGDAGGEVEDGSVLFARSVSTQGRSRAFVGGAAVPVSTLAAVVAPLVAVHGQSDQHRLLKPQAQREALDRFGGEKLAGLLAAYVATYRRLVATERDLASLTTSARERAREADLLRFGLEEIAAVGPQPGEDLELAVLEARLGNADTLRAAAEQAREALSSESGGSDALVALAAARNQLESVRDHDEEVAGLADRLAELTYLLSDLAADVASYSSSVDTDPAHLASISSRRAALTALTRKYGDTVDEILSWAQTSAERLGGLDGADDRIEQLSAERTQLRKTLAAQGSGLSRSRHEAAGRLSVAVTEELHGLAMPHARLEIAVAELVPVGDQSSASTIEIDGRQGRFSSSGLDEVELQLVANTGADPRPLHKGASGGELSRVMLALEVSLAHTSPVPTFVFDEVDSGVGGKAAVEVGARLARLAATAQVLVVTHLPQVAAYADHHVVVRKSSDGSVTTSGLSVLDDQQRVQELSRMLAGAEASNTGLAHAQELLETARADR